ncbi:hypothetical protein B6S12_00895 [Helicobacter valdiviensis]|uniref:Uncharacterized protein n=1 Tax=Helicobacter valdiviensis TaxID=1458358 RepID=A0A2W6MWK6_9HELI|nr:hypothetical protein [Helicobacter valdiviensis]PZT48884.1 hypothetical protein B6S12_00895 [Helicobacter valdiviensis]
MKNKIKKVICVASVLCVSILSAESWDEFIIDNAPSKKREAKTANQEKLKDGVHSFKLSNQTYKFEVKNGLILRAQCPNNSIIKVSSSWQESSVTQAFKIYVQQECMVSGW